MWPHFHSVIDFTSLREGGSDTFKVRKARGNTREIERRKVAEEAEKFKKVSDVRKVIDAEPVGDKRDEADLLMLRHFDMESEYGPCVGITRLERWERASKFGLNPSPDIKAIILKHANDPVYTESLWHDYNL